MLKQWHFVICEYILSDYFAFELGSGLSRIQMQVLVRTPENSRHSALIQDLDLAGKESTFKSGQFPGPCK